MPFEKLRHPQARERARTVLASLERPPSAKLGQLRVRFGPDVCTAAGLVLDQRVEMHWGYGADAGAVLVLPGEDGPKLRTQASRRDKGSPPRADALLETQFGGLPDEARLGVDGAEWMLLPVARAASKCVWRLHEGGVLIELPREWWRVEGAIAGPTAPVGPREAADATVAHPPKRHVDPAPGAEASSPPAGPRSDPDDPKLQDMAQHLLARGCSLPELRTRLRLDEDGFKALCANLRERANRGVGKPAPSVTRQSAADVRDELARIRRLADPTGAAA